MMKQINVRNWAHVALFNLLLVACLGVLMRLKILLPLPWVNQRFTLHAHSHFAFSGWITQALLLSVAIVVLGVKFDEKLPRRYNLLLAFNLFCAYGMLVSFFIQGYAAVSITFSTLSILVSFIFYWFCKKDLTEAVSQSVWWKYIHAALIFNLLSCLGTFALAWTMVFQPANTELRLASVYFYLHFQYNGWFFFACMGLLHHWLQVKHIVLSNKLTLFRIFSISCVPMYLLSINWLAFPLALNGFAIFTALVQFGAFVYFAMTIVQSRNKILDGLPAIARLLMVCVFIAVCVKFTLQTASSIPAIAHLAFGFRTVVIAYLHLVLLGIISLFLIFWFFLNGAINPTATARLGIVIFVFGIIFNEFLLMIQGIGSMSGIYIGYVSEMLALAGLIMGSGLVFLLKDNSRFNTPWFFQETSD